VKHPYKEKKREMKVTFRHNEMVVSKAQYDVAYMLKVSRRFQRTKRKYGLNVQTENMIREDYRERTA
jgi:multimeric flavodoxin WrbA